MSTPALTETVSPQEARIRGLVSQGLSIRAIAVEMRLATRTVVRKLNALGINHQRIERLINAQPWEPLPGMTKRRCQRCQFWFATPSGAQRAWCPDCVKWARD